MHEKLFAIKKLHSTLSLVSIHYNESQANLRVDDDDVHFQRWLLELLVLQLSASISPMIMAAIKYSCGRQQQGTRVIIKTIYLRQIPIKRQYLSVFTPRCSQCVKKLKMSHFNTMRAKRAKFIIKLLLNNFEGEFRCWKIGDTIFSAIIQMRHFW